MPSTLNRRVLIAAAASLAASSAHGQAVEAKAAAAPSLPRVEISTAMGRIVLELDIAKAPLTAANFLRYVDQKRYDLGGHFFRASRAPNAPEIGLIQGGLQGLGVLKPVAHEPTTLTGLKHTDGVVSLARYAPGSGTSDFFICVGDAPYLDADPAAPGDNAGFAAFGRVVEGMEVVRAILALPTPGKAVNPVMNGQILAPQLPFKARRVAATPP
jgi:peptidyl-prolyl cis-trans isomerase A (cyclophilin A)